MNDLLAILSEIAPPFEDADYVAKVTSKQWRADLADILDPEILDAKKMMRSFASQGKFTPPSIANMVLAEDDARDRRRPRGRPKQAVSSPRQQADDAACYLAVDWLEAHDGLKHYPACEKVRKAMNMTLKAVLYACKRIKQPSGKR